MSYKWSSSLWVLIFCGCIYCLFIWYAHSCTCPPTRPQQVTFYIHLQVLVFKEMGDVFPLHSFTSACCELYPLLLIHKGLLWVTLSRCYSFTSDCCELHTFVVAHSQVFVVGDTLTLFIHKCLLWVTHFRCYSLTSACCELLLLLLMHECLLWDTSQVIHSQVLVELYESHTLVALIYKYLLSDGGHSHALCSYS